MVIASIVVLVYMTGPTGIIGWALVLGFVPVQLWVSRYLVRLRKRAIEYTDARIRATREALQGIKVVKAFAWEASIMQSVQKTRSKEIRLIAQLNLLRYSLISLALHSPVFASILTFGALALLGIKLKTGPIFATIGIFNSMSVPLSWFPVALTETRNTLVPLQRITEALLEDELEHQPSVDSNLDAAIKIVGGNFRWDQQQPEAGQSTQSLNTSQINMLKDITLNVPRGSLVIIVGTVGSGKSSLANAIVGEMDCISGTIEYGGTLAYAPQVPWMMNGTIRDNILFGKPFDPEKYLDVIEACELEADLACFPAGDQTEIGGKNLSGGQKQRLSIARVAYAEAEISVLDDCLSAVDTRTSRAIFRQCITGLLASKTRIMVTSSLDYAAAADLVVAMDGGRIAECGSFVDLMAAGGIAATLYNADKEGGAYTTDTSLHTATPIRSAAGSSRSRSNCSSRSSNLSIEITETTESNISTEKKVISTTSAHSGRLIGQEERKTGQITWATYAAYIRASGGVVAIVGIVLCLGLSQGCRVGSDFWMRLWIHHQGKDQTSFYIGLYALLGILQFIFFGAFAAILVYSVYRSSRNLHAQAFRRVLYSPMSFFDTTPLGRILNRFTRDIDSLDMALCDFARQFYQNIGRSIGSFVSISILVPMFLIPLVPLFVASWVLIYVYLRTSVEVQRIAAISRSPLYSHYTETLQGLATIRAFGAQQQYISQANQVLDDANRPHWYSLVIQSWIWLRVDYLSHLLTLVICVIIVAQPTRWDAAAVGLMLVQATQMGAYATYAGRGWSELQNNMNSVERINHYASALEQESNGQGEGCTALSSKLDSAPITMRPITMAWPERGTIIIRGLSLQYRPGLPLALDNVDMEIYSGERIGIIGRSGAGKSSILMALFRLVEPSSGRIFIDGIDTQTVPLSRLRQSIGLLPQDPVLFEGTARSNLDPFHTFDDADLWAILRRVHLFEFISQHPLKLDMPVDEGGDNFSLGQKQLLCLARVLLQRPRILVLDEATASVDHKTDAAIQQIIASGPEMTVISIAHRLQTVATYDRIYLVDNGQIVESGTPLVLLEQLMVRSDINGTNASL
ncbi:hypothetical protein LPJ55_004437 [Coemansia sp. RSA 990]|nr:hypothetical protein LPJ55_004437 [Coemansia sp. RSA 990]